MKQKKFCKICGAPHYGKELCQKCYNREVSRKQYKEHPELLEKRLGQWYARETCAILTKHHREQKDEPQHLPTEFILQQIEELKKNRRR